MTREATARHDARKISAAASDIEPDPLSRQLGQDAVSKEGRTVGEGAAPITVVPATRDFVVIGDSSTGRHASREPQNVKHFGK